MRPDDSDRKAVLGLLRRLALAWNSGAADAYADLFTDDADYVTRFGVNVPGHDAIERAHRALFDGPLRGSRMIETNEPPSVRMLRHDVAIIVATTSVSRPGTVPDRDSTQTLVAVREPDGWRIASFQNTPQTPVHGS